MSKAKGVEIIRYNIIFNFILFVLIIILSILAFKAENDYNSVSSSYNRKNLWCYSKIQCDLDTKNSQTINNFQYNSNHNEVNDQNIIFQYFNGSGVSEQIFNIYTAEEPPPVAQLVDGGVCAGYYHYSSSGTSVYLKYYYNNTSWTGSNVGNLLDLAFKGTSASTLGYSKLNNNTGNFSYIGDKLMGLSIFSSDSSNLFNSDIIFNENSFSTDPNGAKPLNLINNYTQTLQTIKHSEDESNSSWRKCIDPSFIADKVPCPSIDKTVKFANYFYYKYKGNTAPTVLCTADDLGNGKSFDHGECGFPYCYNNYNNNNNGGVYKTQDFFSGGDNIINGKADNSSYTYKGQQIINNGLDLYSDTDNLISNTVQAQALLFCGGTSTTTSNLEDADISGPITKGSTNKANKFPPSTVTGTGTKPYDATQPNIRVKGEGNKVILGFK